jgi:hypothetical protein
MLFLNTFEKSWFSWFTLVQLVLVELSFGRIVVWLSCLLVELVLVDLLVVEMSVVELTDYLLHIAHKI